MMKLFYSCVAATLFALTATATAAETNLEGRIRELEMQFTAAAAGGDSALLHSLKEQVNELYAQRPENQPRDHNPLDQGNDICPGMLIGDVPYTDTGTTAGYQNNYVPLQPCGTNSNAPEVVYNFWPPFTGVFTVSLCGSSYDTYLGHREGDSTISMGRLTQRVIIRRDSRC